MYESICHWCEKLLHESEVRQKFDFTFCPEHHDEFIIGSWEIVLCTSSKLELSSLVQKHDELKRKKIPVLIQTQLRHSYQTNEIESMMFFWIMCKDRKTVLAHFNKN